MSHRHPGAWACLALLLAAGSFVGGVRAAPAACPPLLTLVELLPESTIFSEILMALGAEGGRSDFGQEMLRCSGGFGRQLSRRLPCRTVGASLSCVITFSPLSCPRHSRPL